MVVRTTTVRRLLAVTPRIAPLEGTPIDVTIVNNSMTGIEVAVKRE
jgi:hypothetical protein